MGDLSAWQNKQLISSSRLLRRIVRTILGNTRTSTRLVGLQSPRSRNCSLLSLISENFLLLENAKMGQNGLDLSVVNLGRAEIWWKQMPLIETIPLNREAPDSETCWDLLERVASSILLKRAVRLRDLLLYVGRRSLKEHRDKIHENEIGSAVFDRPTEYDTSVDPIVRVNVTELRKRIEAYFNSEGLHEALIMEIPRGSYIPVFHYRASTPENAAEIASSLHSVAVEPGQAAAETGAAPFSPGSMRIALAVCAVMILALAAGCLYFWSQYRALHQPLFAWQSEPAVAELWSRYLNANPNTDIVISDTGIGLTEALSQKTFPLNDYLSRSYISQLQSADMSQDMHAAVNRILSWNLANPDEFTLARRLLAIDPLGRSMHLYNARNYMPDLIKRDNVILIGARKSNPWDELFDNRMNFITEFDSPMVLNRAPIKGEQATYLPTHSDGYCIIAYMPNSDHSGSVLLIEGTNAEATEAAGDFLLSEDQLSNFKKMLRVRDLPYFQVLLKVSAVRGTPFSASIEAYRTDPPSH